MPARRLPQIACAAALLLAGLSAALSEARPLGSGQITAGAGLSAESRHDALMVCDHALAEPAFSLQSTPSRARIAGPCGSLAARTLRDAPSHGFAHLIAATVARAQGRTDALADHLTRSQAMSPYQGWLAERRFLMLQSAGPALQQRLLPAEVAALMTTQSGAAMLVQALTASGPLREIILTATDSAHTAQRQRLRNLVRQRAGGA